LDPSRPKDEVKREIINDGVLGEKEGISKGESDMPLGKRWEQRPTKKKSGKVVLKTRCVSKGEGGKTL